MNDETKIDFSTNDRIRNTNCNERRHQIFKMVSRLVATKAQSPWRQFKNDPDQKGEVILCLSLWGEGDHPTMQDLNVTFGNSLFYVMRMKMDIEQEPHLNENFWQQQLICEDLDGYYLIICE